MSATPPQALTACQALWPSSGTEMPRATAARLATAKSVTASCSRDIGCGCPAGGPPCGAPTGGPGGLGGASARGRYAVGAPLECDGPDGAAPGWVDPGWAPDVAPSCGLGGGAGDPSGD